MDASGTDLQILTIHPFWFGLLSVKVLLSQQNVGSSQKHIFIAVKKWYFLVCVSNKCIIWK